MIHNSVLQFILGFCGFILVNKNKSAKRQLNIIHVFEHELTHMVASSILGGKFKKMRIHESGEGEVYLTKNNKFTCLLPYIFPLVSMLVFYISIFLHTNYKSFGLVIAGFFYANFLSCSFDNLGIQSDIHKSGGKKRPIRSSCLGICLFYFL